MKNKSAIILVILSIGLFYTFTNVEYAKVKDLHVLATEYQDVLANISDIVRLRDTLLIAYEEFPEADKNRIEKVLPDNIDMVQLALELDSIASRHGISIKDIYIDNDINQNMGVVLPEHTSPYEKVMVSFSFVSNYENFKRLLADMEKSLRIMEIESLSFDVLDSGLYEHDITIETYWLNK